MSASSSGHELIPFIQQEGQIFIDARLLYKKLGSKQEFSAWIKTRIEDFEFEENTDFLINLSKSTGGRKATNYLLSVDMAKELAMLERNAMGKTIRRYFIEAEKKARQVSYLPRYSQLFDGLERKDIYGRKLYYYQDILARCGYSTKSNSSRQHRYPNHFIKIDHKLLVTEEFASHLYHQKAVMNNRTAMKAQQAVLPLDFGNDSNLNTKGGYHG